RWESRSVPFFTRKPLLETVKGFFRLHTSQKVPEGQWHRDKVHRGDTRKSGTDVPQPYYLVQSCMALAQKPHWNPLPKATQKTQLRNSTI
ncbi:hypothetical protein, partial [Sphingobacterium detergens]|uniref:hypothetical protein n=1 Tax=Sphingobacterium detergens TaxID=1145106 RepID=UPI001ABF2D1E